MYSFKLMHILV